ncbi:MAG: hypothetical protein ACI8PZ_006970 [Myxococcota bacterium]
MVAHPAVRALLSRGDPGTQPRRHIVAGTELVAYSATRVHMKRDAWELLSPDGILVQWIRPKGEAPWAIALSYAELLDVFGEVRESASWDAVRCYHFPSTPTAASAFRVLGAGGEPAAPVRRRRGAEGGGVDARPAISRVVVEPVAIDDAVRRVLTHLRAHGSLNEAEVTRMAGGPRAYRRLRLHVEATGAPVRLDVTPLGALWRLREGSE